MRSQRKAVSTATAGYAPTAIETTARRISSLTVIPIANQNADASSRDRAGTALLLANSRAPKVPERGLADVPILLTSGYAEVAAHDAEAEGIGILSKPYGIDELSAALREATSNRAR